MMRNGVWKVECDGVHVGEISDMEYVGLLKQVKQNLMLYPYQLGHSVYVGFKLFLECIPMSTMFCFLLAGLYASAKSSEFNALFSEDPARFFSIIAQISLTAGFVSAITAPMFYGVLKVGFRNFKSEQLHLAIRRHIGLAASGTLTLSFAAASEVSDNTLESDLLE